jgi:hypothetical protein
LTRLKHNGIGFFKLNSWLMPYDGSRRSKQFRTVKHMSFVSLIPYQESERGIGGPFDPSGDKSKFFCGDDDGGRFKPSTRGLKSQYTNDPQMTSPPPAQPSLSVNPFSEYHPQHPDFNNKTLTSLKMTISIMTCMQR